MTQPSLESILQHVYGFWRSAIFAAAIRHDVFGHLEAGARTAGDLADRASISLRGSQAILDGLLGLDLIQGTVNGYAVRPAVARYLVRESNDYLGGYADMILATFSDWSQLPQSVASGKPVHRQESPDPQNSFWERAARATAPLCFPPAHAAADRLRIKDSGAFRMLDIGGGAGAYSAVWLGLNADAACVQLDWPNVNAIARSYVASFGHSNRFETLDGDMEHIEVAPASYDYAIYSNVAHGLSDERNIAMFRRIKGWLKRSGTLIVSSLVPNDDRTGDPLLMLFSSNLLLNSSEGTVHTRRNYESWLRTAGFSRIDFEPLAGLPLTLIYAS